MKQRQRAMLGLGVGLVALLIPGTLPSVLAQSNPSTSQQIWSVMATVNAGLEAAGVNIRIAQADYLTPNDSGEVGQTVFFSDRGNKQLPVHFVPGDPRRDGRTNITYTIDQTEGAVDGLTQAQTNAAITRAMTTWNNVTCSTIPIEQVANPGTDIGIVEFLSGLGGSPLIFADIVHAGWLPAGILPNNVIASTFIFVFVDSNGPTDIDGNGKLDTALTETLYNDFFTWRINANIDVETVALHESGHGLSQDHSGKAFQTTANGVFHFAPRAVMNAGYSGVQQAIGKTDLGGHCSIWASWPQN